MRQMVCVNVLKFNGVQFPKTDAWHDGVQQEFEPYRQLCEIENGKGNAPGSRGADRVLE